jgi:uncharacterized protein YjiS (DUF1127 family)
MADVITRRGVIPARRSPSLGARIASVFAVWRQRRVLAELPDHLRRDVGLSETEITREAQRRSGTFRTSGATERAGGPALWRR